MFTGRRRAHAKATPLLVPRTAVSSRRAIPTLRGCHGMTYCNAGTPGDPAFFLQISPTDTDLLPTPEFGVDSGDSIPAFAAGDLGPGQTVSINVDYVLNTNLNFFFIFGSFVTTTPNCAAPVPSVSPPRPLASLLLLLGIAALPALRPSFRKSERL